MWIFQKGKSFTRARFIKLNVKVNVFLSWVVILSDGHEHVLAVF